LGFLVHPTGLVSVDHDISDFAETTIMRNPSCTKMKADPDMIVHSVFIRRARKQASKTESNTKLVGDNCPFIYAVKRKTPGLYVNFKTIRDLIGPFNQILDKFVEQQQQNGIVYDLIVPMPSSHHIVDILATRLSRKTGVRVCKDLFIKSTVNDVVEMVNADRNMPHNAKLNIISAIQLAREKQRPFSLGDVKTEYRDYIKPLFLSSRIDNDQKLLLVDDLFSSGKTLRTARDELLGCASGLTFDAICLFSPLNNRIRNKNP